MKVKKSTSVSLRIYGLIFISRLQCTNYKYVLISAITKNIFFFKFAIETGVNEAIYYFNLRDNVSTYVMF